jgi:hypothetical protein
MIYLLTAIGLTPGGSSTVHIYTQTIHRTTQLTQIMHPTTQLIGESAGSPRLWELYPGICLTNEEKAQRNLSQGRTEYTEQYRRVTIVKLADYIWLRVLEIG